MGLFGEARGAQRGLSACLFLQVFLPQRVARDSGGCAFLGQPSVGGTSWCRAQCWLWGRGSQECPDCRGALPGEQKGALGAVVLRVQIEGQVCRWTVGPSWGSSGDAGPGWEQAAVGSVLSVSGEVQCVTVGPQRKNAGSSMEDTAPRAPCQLDGAVSRAALSSAPTDVGVRSPSNGPCLHLSWASWRCHVVRPAQLLLWVPLPAVTMGPWKASWKGHAEQMGWAVGWQRGGPLCNSQTASLGLRATPRGPPGSAQGSPHHRSLSPSPALRVLSGVSWLSWHSRAHLASLGRPCAAAPPSWRPFPSGSALTLLPCLGRAAPCSADTSWPGPSRQVWPSVPF